VSVTSPTDHYVAAIHRKLEEVAPENNAPIPLAMSEEAILDRDGRATHDKEWACYMHVRVAGECDVTIETRKPWLADALAEIYRHLCEFNAIKRRSNESALRFGVAPA
jgi:hypothetical protein